jgi:hypothetical protein
MFNRNESTEEAVFNGLTLKNCRHCLILFPSKEEAKAVRHSRKDFLSLLFMFCIMDCQRHFPMIFWQCLKGYWEQVDALVNFCLYNTTFTAVKKGQEIIHNLLNCSHFELAHKLEGLFCPQDPNFATFLKDNQEPKVLFGLLLQRYIRARSTMKKTITPGYTIETRQPLVENSVAYILYNELY